MWTGLVGGKLSCIARATSSVARVQISMSSWRRSKSVIRPRAYCFSTFSAFSSAFASRPALAGGAMTSEMEMVTPERVAQWKPRALSWSSVLATSIFG